MANLVLVLVNLIALPALLVFVVIINPSSHADAVFVSIDCGFTGSSTYKDENSIVWTGDEAYIHNKHESQVFNEYYSSNTPVDWTSTVRVFPTLNKNCYTIPIGKAGERLLVRASFRYWDFHNNPNYSATSPGPTFELQFDGNYWTTVVTKPYDIVSYEAIYVAKANTTSICVAKTKDNQLPFISALELRSLDFKMYSHVDSNYALLLANRHTDGTNQTVRYPDDAYDRIWVPESGFIFTKTVKGEARSIDTSSAQDNPPEAVLQDAVETTGTRWSLVLDTSGLPQSQDQKVRIYMTTYFSEVIRPLNSSTDKRSLQVLVDGNPYSGTIVPPFGSVSTVYITNITAYSNTNFTIESTLQSTLPPLISAYELYTITGPLTQATTSTKDVEGLAALQREFKILQKWSGDPCLPSSFAWEWVECTNTTIYATPRVTSLKLSGFGLFGPLPDFSSMDGLQKIDFHNNSLDGPIPDFLGSLPNLNLLLTGNCLSGMSCPPNDASPPPPAGPPPPDSTPSDSPAPGRSPPEDSPASGPSPHNSPSPGSLPPSGLSPPDSPLVLQTPSSSGPNQYEAPPPPLGHHNSSEIPSPSGDKECSDKPQMILGIIIHVSLISFMFSNF
ncbi:uncharacterized protein At1g24485-like [Prunus dulcis]|uniref:uncharacterized protein At1g24485-like n=1 Tax=Prunus dulcis TaxID=3755 RepID=UPI001482C25A|nr:uncharacterized protein At1g24485-like [Prunus dulcis]